MPDPIDRLRSFDPGDLSPHASAHDVRRRGERLRRRRVAGVAVASAALAAAAVVVPMTLVGGEGRADRAPVAPSPTVSTDDSPTDPPPTDETTTAPPTTDESPDAPPSTDETTTEETDTEETTTDRGEVPAEFPLAAGYPPDSDAEPGSRTGLHGPAPALDRLDLEVRACGELLATPPDVTGRLEAAWLNVEDFRSRRLVTFADAERAVAHLDEAAAFFRQCGGDADSTWTVLQTQVGGQSYAIGRTPTAEIGQVETIVLVRLGRAVLIDVRSGEGGGGDPDPALVRERAADMAGDAAGVVAAMCTFTEAGC